MEKFNDVPLNQVAEDLGQPPTLVLEIASLLGIKPKVVDGEQYLSAANATKVKLAIHRAAQSNARNRAASRVFSS